LAAAIPDDDERDLVIKTATLQQLCAAFEADFPVI